MGGEAEVMNEYDYLMDLIRRYGAAEVDAGDAKHDSRAEHARCQGAAARLYDRLAYDVRRCLERRDDVKQDRDRL